jgi:hypothetical protein
LIAPRPLVTLIALFLALAWAGNLAHAQVLSGAEAQAVWDSFWARIVDGDLNGARRFVHTMRQAVPWMVAGTQLQDMARQMQRCRLSADPLPDSGEDVLFEVRCEQAGRTASTLVGFRQDLDGTWRLTVL